MSKFEARVRADVAMHSSRIVTTKRPSAIPASMTTIAPANAMRVCDLFASCSLGAVPVPSRIQTHVEGGLPW